MVEGVFCDCEALTSIEIPASVEMIDMYYCINLANIYCYPSIPPILNVFITIEQPKLIRNIRV